MARSLRTKSNDRASNEKIFAEEIAPQPSYQTGAEGSGMTVSEVNQRVTDLDASLQEKADRIVLDAERAKSISYLGFVILLVMVAAMLISLWIFIDGRNYIAEKSREDVILHGVRIQYLERNLESIYARNPYLK